MLLRPFRFFVLFFAWALLETATRSGPAMAGPVNSPQSYPFAVSNSQGDTLSLGDIKGLFQGRALTGTERSAAVKLGSSDEVFPRFSGGMAEAESWEGGRPFAIACSNQAIALFSPARSPAYPGGRWTEVQGPTITRRPLQCAMLSSGSFAWLDGDAGLLRIDDTQSLPLPFKSPDLTLLSAGGQFWVLEPGGQAVAAERQASAWTWSAPQAHPFKRFGALSRFTGNARKVLRADADGVWLASLEGGRWGPAVRLPVNPCGREQVCGLSLAADDSWLVSGFWGHFLGLGQDFLRLPFPLSAAEDFGVAIAHQGLAAAYLYLGTDDGDRGLLPAWTPQARTRAAQERWFVWSREQPETASLLRLPLQRSPQSAVRSAEELYLFVWQGALPSPLPNAWVAWEADASWTLASTPLPLAVSREASWWQDALGSETAQQVARAADRSPAIVHVAMIDSGIDPAHPWLLEQRWLAPGEIPGNGLDDDDNGFVDDQWGYDFVDEDGEPEDTFGHGTHVAGLMMARQGSSIRSPAPNLRLTVVRALDRYGKSNSIDLARGLVYALDKGAQLINCSWGGGTDTQALRDVFALLRMRGVAVVSSAGNDRLDTDVYPEVPKNYPGLISVGSTDQQGRLASFSNFGKRSVTWLTPGDEILSTVRSGSFGTMSGTSMSAPLGTASLAWIYGLMQTRAGPLTPAAALLEAQDILCRTADKGGMENRSLCGRLQLDAATRLVLKETGS